MHPFEDLIHPEARMIGGAIDEMLDKDYPEHFARVGLDPHRHGFRFVRQPFDVMRVTCDPHPLWPCLSYDRGHGKFGSPNVNDMSGHLQAYAHLDRLQDRLRNAGLPEKLPPCMFRVPTILRSELEHRGIGGRDLLDIRHSGTSIPQLVWIGAATHPKSALVTKMSQKDAGALPESGPSMLLRRYVDRYDIVMMELAPGVVIEEEVGGHQIRFEGQAFPSTLISSMGTLAGRHVSEIVAHPALVTPDLTIQSVRAYKKLTKIVVRSGTTRLEDVPEEMKPVFD